MSIWRDIFDIGQAGNSSDKGETLEGPLGRFLAAVRCWSSPLFGTCDKHDQTRVPKTRKGVQSVAFTIAVVVLSAKLAKADGQVTRDEVATFKQLFTVPVKEQANVGRLFNQARKEAGGFESYARQLGSMFDQEKQILADLVGCLFAIAAADGRISSEETDYLRNVAEIFGIAHDEFSQIAERYTNTPIDDPYLILGANPRETIEQIRKRYRRLVAKIHPDRLAALGLPQERMEQATKQLARVNAAFDQICKRHAAPELLETA